MTHDPDKIWPIVLVLTLGTMAVIGLIGGAAMLISRTSLAALDARLKQQSRPAWITLRVVAGTLTALGLFSWVGLWFQRGFWLGVAQAIMCGSVLANELGLLRRLGSGPQSLP